MGNKKDFNKTEKFSPVDKPTQPKPSDKASGEQKGEWKQAMRDHYKSQPNTKKTKENHKGGQRTHEDDDCEGW